MIRIVIRMEQIGTIFGQVSSGTQVNFYLSSTYRLSHLSAKLVGMEFLLILSLFFSSVISVEILYDGRAQANFDAGVLDNSSGQYLTYVMSFLRWTWHLLNMVLPTAPSGALKRQAMYVLQNFYRSF